jgi:hypothetical protein
MKHWKLFLLVLGIIIIAGALMKPSDSKCLSETESVFRETSIDYVNSYDIEVTSSNGYVFRPKTDFAGYKPVSTQQKVQLVEGYVSRGMQRVRVIDYFLFKKIVGRQGEEDKPIGYGMFNLVYITFKQPKVTHDYSSRDIASLRASVK